ncbi:cell envelope biogenesis protein LolA [Rhodobacter xanthinilyticus]|uniref:Cell envelope biogenesis protein LolA n=1 Tax=Rhodobacter xanthinilyticus TaxID=1850250 RepID=A0A1D9M8U6_9RHOB|nr:outer membrane lipoprotein carrier protein LolA [Rhodobacter xanthinilyticus]AOZ68257.1 cell envelope biogenesis protein LolA [Rhodobacter xanthinilyticus]
MTLLRFALAPVFTLALAVPALAEKIPLGELSSYLNGLKTAEASFTQVNADGSVSTGKMYLQRPGRVRFEYDKDKTLVMASGGQVAIFDPKSNMGPEQYPLSKTPLNLILAETVDLARAKMVVGHTADDKTTSVTAQDPEHPDYGTIKLVFTAKPTELRQWVITDDSGGQTTVILGEMKKGVTIAPSLFSIVNETNKRK